MPIQELFPAGGCEHLLPFAAGYLRAPFLLLSTFLLLGCLWAPFPVALGAPVHPFPGLVSVGTMHLCSWLPWEPLSITYCFIPPGFCAMLKVCSCRPVHALGGKEDSYFGYTKSRYAICGGTASYRLPVCIRMHVYACMFICLCSLVS